MNGKPGRRFPWKRSHTDPFGGALAAAAATGEHWRGNRAWCAVCGDPIRAHPKSESLSAHFRLRSAAAMLGQKYIYCCRANKPALICSNGFELVPSGGIYACVSTCVLGGARVMREPCCFRRDGFSELCWIPPVTRAHTHSRRCNHARTHFPYKQLFISAFNVRVFNC